jgi:hypothetical protein
LAEFGWPTRASAHGPAIERKANDVAIANLGAAHTAKGG